MGADADDLKENSETLFIPLYGKANVHRYGDILDDPKARDIVSRVSYDFAKNERNKFLDIYMGIRAAILDRHVRRFLERWPDGIVIHVGCGLDARVERVGVRAKRWYDLDLPDVIDVRRRFYEESDAYRMIAASVTEHAWLDRIAYDGEPVLVVAEGLTMYLTDAENRALFAAFARRFRYTEYVFDAYSVSAVKWSRRKNPVNRMGAHIVWGLDDPGLMEAAAPGVTHVGTEHFTGPEWEAKLSGGTRFWFRALYGNAWANNLYRIYRFRIQGA